MPVAPGRVLVAEDEEHLGMLLAQFLRARGLDVTLVRDGSAALDALAADRFDVAVVDVQMPGVDGFAVLAAAGRQARPAEVIIASGNATRETALAALRGGAYGTVAKPYRMAEVELIVQRAVETRRLRDAVLTLRRERDELRAALGLSPDATQRDDDDGTIDAGGSGA